MHIVAYMLISSFLNTGVILANFINDGNIASANDLLNSSRRIVVKMSILSLITLVGISESCAALIDEFYKFFKKNSVTQETIDPNILWPSNFFRKYFIFHGPCH